MVDRVDWKAEIDCGPIELFIRRKFTSLFYTHLYRRIWPDTPWLTPGAIRLIKKHVNRHTNVFEFGSGQSTVWFAKRVKNVFSVENSHEWFKIITNKLPEGDSNVQLYFEDTTDGRYDNYVNRILDFEDDFFDLVLVDGRQRVACIKNSIKKIKIGGILVLDDSQRPRYREAYVRLSEYERIDYCFGFKRTSIWFIQ